MKPSALPSGWSDLSLRPRRPGAGTPRRTGWGALGVFLLGLLASLDALGAAATIWLPDYEYPARVGNYWVYDSTVGSGSSRTMVVTVEAVNESITSYTGTRTIVPVTRRADWVRFDREGSRWLNYRVPADLGWGWLGSDDEDDEVRFDPPFAITNRVAVGQKITLKGTLYSRGGNPRPGTAVVEILGFEDVTAGGRRFDGCLHLKLTLSTKLRTTVDEQWLAPGFGAVKFTHGSKGGPLEVNLLKDFSYLTPPRVVFPASSVTNSLGSTARLAAEVIGSAPITLRWRRDGRDLADDGRIHGTATSTLTIADVGFADAGAFELVARSPYGTSTGVVTLVVLDRTPPTVTVDSHTDVQWLTAATATLAGTASDAGLGANGIASVTVNRARAAGDTATGAGTAHWTRPLKLTAGTNLISVVARDGQGNAATNSLRLVSDPVRPSVAITTPTRGQRVLTDSRDFLVKGTAKDNLGLAEVRMQANGGPWTVVTGTRTWEAPMHLNAGTNVVSTYAIDVAGNASPTNSVQFTYVVSSRLTLRVIGNGTVSGVTNGQPLEIGRAYTLKSTPGKGSGLVHWTDGAGTVLGTKPSLTVVMSAGLTLVATFADSQPPTLTIVNPKAKARILSADGRVTVQGTAADNVGVTGVYYQQEGGEWRLAGGTTSWSAVIPARAGSNTVRAFAEDAAGRRSMTNSVTFQYVVSSPLTLRIVGSGTVSGATNGQPLEIGKSYTLKAAAAKGSGLIHWTDGAGVELGTLASLTFTMAEGFTVVATFGDSQKPTLTITSPTPNQEISDATWRVRGTASDNVAIRRVMVQFNGGAWETAAGTGAWEHTVSLVSGPNLLAAYAVDDAGNRSPTNTVRFVGLQNLVPTYWPMSSGDYKQYEGPLGTATLSFSGGPNEFTMDLTTPEDDVTSFYEYGPGRTDVRLTGGKYGWTRFEFTPPIIELDADLVLRGGSRTTSFRIVVRGESFAASAKVKVSMAGSVTVPAGTFADCRRIDLTVTATVPGEGSGTFSSEAYILAPRVGMVRIAVYEGDGSSFRFRGWQDLVAGSVGGVDVRTLASPAAPALADLGTAPGEPPFLEVVSGPGFGGAEGLVLRVTGVPGTHVVWESSPDLQDWTPRGESVLAEDGSAVVDSGPVTTEPTLFFRVRTVAHEAATPRDMRGEP